MMGQGNEMTNVKKVTRIVLSITREKSGLETNLRKCLSPTHGLRKNPSGAMKSRNAICSPTIGMYWKTMRITMPGMTKRNGSATYLNL